MRCPSPDLPCGGLHGPGPRPARNGVQGRAVGVRVIRGYSPERHEVITLECLDLDREIGGGVVPVIEVYGQAILAPVGCDYSDFQSKQ